MRFDNSADSRLSRARVVAGNRKRVDAKIAVRTATVAAGVARSPPAPDVRHLDLDRDLAAVALHRQRHVFPHPDALELLDQVREPAYRLSVHPHDDVADLSAARVDTAQPGALGGGAWAGSHDDDALRAGARSRCFAGGNDADPRGRHRA